MLLQNIFFHDFHSLGHSREETPPGSNRWHTYQQNSSFTNARPSFHIPCIICTGMYCPKGYRFWADGYRICPLWLEIKYSFQEDHERVLGECKKCICRFKNNKRWRPSWKKGGIVCFYLKYCQDLDNRVSNPPDPRIPRSNPLPRFHSIWIRIQSPSLPLFIFTNILPVTEYVQQCLL